jgi:type IV secretory pathway VirB4 component
MITGGTGAGKSVTMCDFILQSLRQDPYVIVIDKGNSYQRIGEYNNAPYLKFEGTPEVILDPFVIGNRDEDHRAFLVSLLSTMITGGTEAINREEVSILSEVVYKVLSQQAEPSLNAIVSTLRSNDDSISRSIARKFYPFYGNGQYARFFEGDKPVLNIKNKFTIFELGDIEAHKDLQAVIVSQLIHYVTEFVKTLPGVRKYLVIDEAWSLFKNDIAVQFLVKAVKTFRKYGVSVIFLTQQVEDFAVVAEALNMADNCPNQIFLQQKFDVIDRMKDTFGLSKGELEMYRSVRKTNRYSEALIKTERWSSVVRIMLDPKGYWLTTTKDSDKAYLARLMQNMSLREAINKASIEHPYGITA